MNDDLRIANDGEGGLMMRRTVAAPPFFFAVTALIPVGTSSKINTSMTR